MPHSRRAEITGADAEHRDCPPASGRYRTAAMEPGAVFDHSGRDRRKVGSCVAWRTGVCDRVPLLAQAREVLMTPVAPSGALS
jgi:hypothetical protein